MAFSEKEIVFVEDDENYVCIYKRALFLAALPIRATFVRSLEQVQTVMLSRMLLSSLPCLVIIDLKLRGCDGFQVLQWIKEQPALSEVPLWVMTASSLESDKDKARQLGVERYLIKGLATKELSRFFVMNFKPLLQEQGVMV